MAHYVCLVLCLFAMFGLPLMLAVFKLASYYERNPFPKTEQTALAVPGCSEMLNAPEGPGWPVNKPLMRKPRAMLIRLPDGDTAGNNLHQTRRNILRKLAARGLKFPAPYHSPGSRDKVQAE